MYKDDYAKRQTEKTLDFYLNEMNNFYRNATSRINNEESKDNIDDIAEENENQSETPEILPEEITPESEFNNLKNKTNQTGIIRILVCMGRKTFPVADASVVISISYPSGKYVVLSTKTDSSGMTEEINLPITAYENSDNLTYDAEITHPQFVPVILENICVHNGQKSVLNVDMTLKAVNPEKNKIIILSYDMLTIPENHNAIADEIIRHYYESNGENPENDDTYSENPLIPGTSGNAVKALKFQLNRIGRNYPSIPLLDTKNGDFDLDTQKAVSAFQNIFGLEQNGAADKATRNKIKAIYSDIKKLNELLTESVYYKNVQNVPPEEQKEGSTGRKVKYIQYFLSLIGYFNESIPAVKHSGIYDNPTKDAVLTLQREYDLFQDGITGRETWNKLLNLYFDLTSSLPQAYSEEKADVFPGYVMTRGMRDNNINKLQKYLEFICEENTEIPKPDQNGYYGNQTFSAVKEFQKKYNLKQTGATGAITWNKIAEVYNELKNN